MTIRRRRRYKVDDIPLRPLPDLVALHTRDITYEITEARLELSGYCPACRARRRKQAGSAVVR